MRPTDLIRKLLVLEMIGDQLASELRMVRQQMRDTDVRIIDRHDEAVDVRVEYQHGARIHNIVFMRPMLDADVEGRMRVLRGAVKK